MNSLQKNKLFAIIKKGIFSFEKYENKSLLKQNNCDEFAKLLENAHEAFKNAKIIQNVKNSKILNIMEMEILKKPDFALSLAEISRYLNRFSHENRKNRFLEKEVSPHLEKSEFNEIHDYFTKILRNSHYKESLQVLDFLRKETAPAMAKTDFKEIVEFFDAEIKSHIDQDDLHKPLDEQKQNKEVAEIGKITFTSSDPEKVKKHNFSSALNSISSFRIFTFGNPNSDKLSKNENFGTIQTALDSIKFVFEKEPSNRNNTSLLQSSSKKSNRAENYDESKEEQRGFADVSMREIQEGDESSLPQKSSNYFGSNNNPFQNNSNDDEVVVVEQHCSIFDPDEIGHRSRIKHISQKPSVQMEDVSNFDDSRKNFEGSSKSPRKLSPATLSENKNYLSSKTRKMICTISSIVEDLEITPFKAMRTHDSHGKHNLKVVMQTNYNLSRMSLISARKGVTKSMIHFGDISEIAESKQPKINKSSSCESKKMKNNVLNIDFNAPQFQKSDFIKRISFSEADLENVMKNVSPQKPLQKQKKIKGNFFVLNI